jgi:integrase
MRKDELSYTSINETIRPAVEVFVEWCERKGIENLNELGGRELKEFKLWCKDNTEKNRVSLNGILAVLRRFLVFCVEDEAVSEDVPRKVPISNLSDDVEVCYDKPSSEQVEEVLSYLEQYEPGSRRHVEYAIMEEVGNRVGALRGIDIRDIDLEEREIKFRHRPAEEFGVKGTPLKNENDGQRSVNISHELAELIQQYLNNPDRYDVTDKFGRKPLLTTASGRPTVDTVRRDLYKLTRPCVYSDTCPHDRDIQECDAAQNANASKCPTSHSPHPLRRWSIEKQIDRGVPKEKLCNRVDVSVPVLNKHYDTRSEERKRKQRLEIYEKLFADYGDASATLSTEEYDAITNDDGTVDAVALKQLINSETRVEDTSSTQDDNTDATGNTNSKTDDTEATDDSESTSKSGTQGTLSNFTGSFSQPLAVPLFGVVATMNWVPDRIRRELTALTPPDEHSPWPDPNRMAKGAAAYALYVCLVAVNLTLIGAFPA